MWPFIERDEVTLDDFREILHVTLVRHVLIFTLYGLIIEFRLLNTVFVEYLIAEMKG